MVTAIRVDNLSKRYRLGGQDVWALRDVGFAVGAGEALGIIGKNGAGKSTLLKLLSRITRQSDGTIRIKGRTASLLEVGTGFHPDLSGRENVFLNGALLGLSRRDIVARFSDIVEFAGIGDYIDAPVKKYSSGMKVRLGFGVAAHLDADVMLVDEVLAVGDFEFQRRCLDRMRNVAAGGRTVLFVSHSMQAVASLTTRCLLIDRGRLVADGQTRSVIEKYLAQGASEEAYVCAADPGKRAWFERVNIGRDGDEVRLDIVAHVTAKVRAALCLEIRNGQGVVIASLRDTDARPAEYAREIGRIEQSVQFSTAALVPDTYYVTLSLAELGVERYDYQENALAFHVLADDGTSIDQTTRPGVVRLAGRWS